MSSQNISQTITYGTFTNGKSATQIFNEKRVPNFTKSLREHIRRNTEVFAYTH